MTILNLMKMAESSPEEKKTVWAKDKLLATSIFSFFHSVSKTIICRNVKTRVCLVKG